MHYHLSVQKNKVQIRSTATSGPSENVHVVTSALDYACYLIEEAKKHKCTPDDFCTMCSSSMDHPEDSTDNKATIKLAFAIRNGDLKVLIDGEREKMGRGKKLSRIHRQQLRVLRDHLTQQLDATRKEMDALHKRAAGITAQIEGKLP